MRTKHCDWWWQQWCLRRRCLSNDNNLYVAYQKYTLSKCQVAKWREGKFSGECIFNATPVQNRKSPPVNRDDLITSPDGVFLGKYKNVSTFSIMYQYWVGVCVFLSLEDKDSFNLNILSYDPWGWVTPWSQRSSSYFIDLILSEFTDFTTKHINGVVGLAICQDFLPRNW